MKKKADDVIEETTESGGSAAVPEKKPETTYTADEFAANPALFGERMKSEIITAAFRFNNIGSATLEDAKKIVDKFVKREVK